MSVLVQAWVYANSEARLADRLVLLAIADEADDDGGSAYPSLRRIAHKARVSVGTVSDAVRRLEATGALVVTRPEKSGRGHHNTYQVLMKKGSDSEPLATEERAETRGNARPRGDTDPLTHRPQDQEQDRASLSLSANGSERDTAEEPRATQKSPRGARKTDPRSDAIVRTWWEAQTPRPLQPWVAAVTCVSKALSAGWSEAEVATALRGLAPPLSGGRLDYALDRAFPRRRGEQPTNAAPAERDGDRDAGMEFMVLVDGEWVEATA